MKFSLITTTLALASAAVAAPGWGNNNNQPWNQWQNQLSQSAAENIVNKFISVLTHTDNVKANATAQALLANDFSEVSDSILSLEGQPVCNKHALTDNLLTFLAWWQLFPFQTGIHQRSSRLSTRYRR